MTSEGILAVLWVATLLTISLPEIRAADCSNTAVTKRLSGCVQLDFGSLMVVQKFESLISNLCGSVDCSLACYESALRDCTSEGMFRAVDFKVNRVAMRYACEDPNGLLAAIKKCGGNLSSWTCFSELIQDMMNVTSAILTTPPDNDAYVTGFCNAAKDYRSCSSTTPLTLSGTCTSSLATILTKVYDISMSLETCGINQTDPLFAKYGGPPVDTTCGGLIVQPFHVLLLAAVLVLSFL